MECPKCGKSVSKKDPFCPHCGNRLKHPFRAIFITTLVFIVAMSIAIAAFWFKDGVPGKTKPSAKEEPIAISKEEEHATEAIKDKTKEEPVKQETSEKNTSGSSDEYIQGADAQPEQPKIEKQTMNLEKKEDITNYIDSAKESVFTVTTPEMQGSGFLYNSNGIIVTNAHVIEGWTEATVHSSTGESFTGKVIGYSNKTDVAIVQVPELAGRQPFPIDTSSSINIGDEIVTLGSPLGKENTATMGYLTGTDRSFIIGTFTYDHLFQISAPTAPGSSGGPLISKNSRKIIAINSAQSTSNVSVGFSIPISQVSSLIDGWISSPMNEKQLLAQFYGMDGEYVFGDDWEAEDGRFEDGDVSKDKDHYDYWEYDYDQYWKENGEKAPDSEQTEPAQGNDNTSPADNSGQDNNTPDIPQNSNPDQSNEKNQSETPDSPQNNTDQNKDSSNPQTDQEQQQSPDSANAA
ncbi:trypsin-like peptidase domain-containing protein [Aciduricibacillus chroicocephali]|uniref:Trypsin-like peptidase domain-containing protein n=1 Tax=Aciduricibacillus chroicocephali TaxID=3054939 RepID=A0ABY9KU08_9BACI|nr:trypsin-like peptidase domain-containing protein [Bacillaceae bacterium 44XB]